MGTVSGLDWEGDALSEIGPEGDRWQKYWLGVELLGAKRTHTLTEDDRVRSNPACPPTGNPVIY